MKTVHRTGLTGLSTLLRALLALRKDAVRAREATALADLSRRAGPALRAFYFERDTDAAKTRGAPAPNAVPAERRPAHVFLDPRHTTAVACILLGGVVVQVAQVAPLLA